MLHKILASFLPQQLKPTTTSTANDADVVMLSEADFVTTAEQFRTLSSRDIMFKNLSKYDVTQPGHLEAMQTRMLQERIKTVLVQLPDLFPNIYAATRTAHPQVAKFIQAFHDPRVVSHFYVSEIVSSIDFKDVSLDVISVIEKIARERLYEATAPKATAQEQCRCGQIIQLIERELKTHDKENVDYWASVVKNLNAVPSRSASHIAQLGAENAEHAIDLKNAELSEQFPVPVSAVPKRVKSLTLTVDPDKFAEEVRTFMNANNCQVIGTSPLQANYQGVALNMGDYTLYIEASLSQARLDNLSTGLNEAERAELFSSIDKRMEGHTFDPIAAKAFLANAKGAKGGASSFEFVVDDLSKVWVYKQRHDSYFGLPRSEYEAMDVEWVPYDSGTGFMETLTPGYVTANYFPDSPLIQAAFTPGEGLKPGYEAVNADAEYRFPQHPEFEQEQVIFDSHEDIQKIKTAVPNSVLSNELPQLFRHDGKSLRFEFDHMVSLTVDRASFETMRVVYNEACFQAIPGEHVQSPKTSFGTSVYKPQASPIFEGKEQDVDPHKTGPLFPAIWPEIVFDSFKDKNPHLVLEAFANSTSDEPRPITPTERLLAMRPIVEDSSETSASSPSDAESAMPPEETPKLRPANINDIVYKAESFEVPQAFKTRLEALNASEELPKELDSSALKLVPPTVENMEKSLDQTHDQMGQLIDPHMVQHLAMRITSLKGEAYEAMIQTWRENSVSAARYEEQLRKTLVLVKKEKEFPHVKGNEELEAIYDMAIAQLEQMHVRAIKIMPKPNPAYYQTLSSKFKSLVRQSVDDPALVQRADLLIDKLIGIADRSGTLLDFSVAAGKEGALQQVFTGGTLHPLSMFFELAARACTNEEWELLDELRAICGSFGTSNFTQLVIGLQEAIRIGKAMKVLNRASTDEKIFKLKRDPSGEFQIFCDAYDAAEHAFVEYPLGVPVGA